ncbi:MAG: hypothetical protein KME21_12940 [Desmonostoc vinosum HA7617-LM4]|jgi:hypothetical protein|nr:hypothetical protein [Desmonostoc vinosum HA7617-LM4]
MLYYNIDEFSLGIEAEATSEGKWISKRFTGKWMNSTQTVIPNIIEQAINSDDFATRSTSSLNPAIIGRVLRSKENIYWSVIAIATPATDESRIFTAYRYFYCEGKDNLCLIVGWLNKQIAANKTPVFNPFNDQIRTIIIDEHDAEQYRKQAYQLDKQINNSPDLLDWLKRNSPPPIKIKPTTQYSIAEIDRLATKIAQEHDYLISWSHNVEALDKPERFLIIQPASQEAYEKNFHSVKRYPVVVPVTTNETEFKSAIKDLIRLKKPNENLKIIEYTLESLKNENTEVSKKYLNQVFDDLGARTELREPAYTLDMMELLTVRAIVLPETLAPEYAKYAHLEQNLQANLPFSNKNIRQQSLDFQAELRKQIKLLYNSLPNLNRKLRDGLLIAIQQLLQNGISKNTVISLMTERNSIWRLANDELLTTIRYDLWQIYEIHRPRKVGETQTQKTLEDHSGLWRDLIKGYWRNRQHHGTYQPLTIYKPLAELFSTLQLDDLAAYFYKVSTGKFPHKVLKNLQTKNITDVFGIATVTPKPYNQPEDENSSKSVELSNLFISAFLIVILLGKLLELGIIGFLASILRENSRVLQFICVGIAILLIFIYTQFNRVRAWTKNYALTLIILAFTIGNFIGGTFNKTTPPQPPIVESTPTTLNNAQVTAKLDKAVESFAQQNKTRDAIRKIQQNIIDDSELLVYSLQEEEVTKALKTVIELDKNVDLTEIIQNINENNKNKFQQKLRPVVTAIYKFQNENKIADDGIINLVNVQNTPNSTMRILQDKVKQQIRNQKAGNTD